MSSTIIERELAENTFSALFKYAKHILQFHLDGVMAENSAAHEAGLPQEENQAA